MAKLKKRSLSFVTKKERPQEFLEGVLLFTNLFTILFTQTILSKLIKNSPEARLNLRAYSSG